MKPFAAKFYVTFRCNSRCEYCNVWSDQRYSGKAELDEVEGKRVIEELHEAGVRYIDFTGGEPNLHKGLKALLKACKALGIKTEVTSNGTGGSEARNRLIECLPWIDKFNISLDTLSPERYKRARGIDRLEEVVTTIEETSKIKPPKLMVVVTDENKDELDEILAFARKHGATAYLSPVFKYFEGGKEHDDVELAIREKFFAPNAIVHLHFARFFKRQAKNKHQMPPCSANSQVITIGPDGSLVLPCYHAMAKMERWTGKPGEHLAREEMKAWRGGFLECCKGCTAIPYFGGTFNLTLNGEFLLQSYSHKLAQLKTEFLNEMPAAGNEKVLLELLRELEMLADSLGTETEAPYETGTENPFFYPGGQNCQLFKERLSKEEYEHDLQQADCWGLSRAPHRSYEVFYKNTYPELRRKRLCGEISENEYQRKIQESPEVQLRWWIDKSQKIFRTERRGNSYRIE
ncbi:MAG: radical SAM protein [Methylomicrobium sp.]|nr:radical SAM protein [Methylomicrobium sp.]